MRQDGSSARGKHPLAGSYKLRSNKCQDLDEMGLLTKSEWHDDYTAGTATRIASLYGSNPLCDSSGLHGAPK